MRLVRMAFVGVVLLTGCSASDAECGPEIIAGDGVMFHAEDSGDIRASCDCPKPPALKEYVLAQEFLAALKKANLTSEQVKRAFEIAKDEYDGSFTLQLDKSR